MNRIKYPGLKSSVFFMLAVLFSATALKAQTISTIAGNRSNGFSGDGGQATAAALNSPGSLAISSAGDFYVADMANNRIRKITSAGIITTIAGNGTAGATGDGGAATAATLNSPMAVAVDAAGNVFIADYNNAKIRKVNTFGVISTIAGTGTIGYSGNGAAATAALIAKPTGVAVDASGIVYLAEQNNQVVRKVNASGIISIVAGGIGAGFSGDGGQASAAAVSYPFGVAVDPSGNLLITDNGNNRIRKVSTGGIITTLAGNGSAGFSGDGGNATAGSLNNPSGAIIDASGNLFIADQNNNRIRMVNSSGIISTYAGTATGGYSGDGGPASACSFYKPANVAFASGNLYVADMGNSAIRRIGTATVSHTPTFTGGAVQTLGLCTSASATAINTLMAIADVDASQTETWTVTQAPLHGTLAGFPRTATSTGAVVTPASLTYTPATGYTGADSFKVQISDGSLTSTTTIRVTTTATPSAGTITGVSSLCEGLTTTFGNATTGGTWSTSNTTIATISATGLLIAVVPGNFTISYSVTGSCGTAVATKADTIKALPARGGGAIAGITTVSVGSSISLAVSSGTGTWVTGAPSIATVNASGVVTGLAVGAAPISYTETNSCGSALTQTTITVTAAVVHNPSFTGGSVQTLGLCTSASATAINTQMAITDVDASQTETWTVTQVPLHGTLAGFPRTATSTGGTVTPTGLTYTPTAGYTGTDSIKVQVSDGALSGTTTIGITITATPSAGTISGATSVCAASSITLTPSVTGGMWSSANTTIASVSAAGVVRGIAAGITTISYIVTNSCGTAIATKADTVKAFPSAGSISGASSECVGANITLTASGSGGTWTTSNSAIATATAAGVIRGVAAGVATVSYTVNNGCGSSSAFKIDTVFASPSAGTISGSATVCTGTTISLTTTGTGGTWSSGSAGIATVNGSGFVTGITTGAATISYTVTNACGTAIATKVVTVNTTANPGTITGASSLNVGTSVTLTNAVSGGTWSTSNAAVASITSIGQVFGITVGTATISYAVASSCGSVAATMSMTVTSGSSSGSNIIKRFAGNTSAAYSGDGGSATAAAINHPSGMAVDASGNIYFADAANNRVRRVTTSGVITTIAGNGSRGYAGDGGAATAASFDGPFAVAVDAAGNTYIADYNNNFVRVVSASGTIRLLMGGGYESIEGYPATTFPIARPDGIAVDASGNVYVSDQNNNKIWRINTTGFAYTAAGNFTSGFSGDGGPASAANISYPGALTVDASGNLYFVDGNNNRVRKVSTSGIITTVAGNGSVGSSGDGGQATAASLNIPSGLAFDAAGNLLITDQGNQRVRQVSPAGIITSIAGTGAIGSTGDGGPATAATFYNPMGIVAYGGSIYVADMGNNTIRQIGTVTANHAPTFNGGATQQLSACSGTATSISSRLSITDIDAAQTETWTVVSSPAHGTLTGLATTATSNGAILIPGAVNYTPTAGYAGTDTFRIRVSDGTNINTTLVTATVAAGVNAGIITGPSKVCASAHAWVTFTNSVAGGTWSTSDPSATTINSITGALYPNWGANFTISYTVSNVCGLAISTKPDTSLTLPVLSSITGPTTVAVGATITLANSLAGGTWTSSSTTVASVTSTGVVRGNTDGYATITYSATNYCGSSSTSQAITVGTPPVSPYIFNFAGNNAMSTGYESSTYKDDGFNANFRKIYFPSGVAKDRNGFIYFSEQGNNLVRKVSTITGELITIAGNYPNVGYSGDGGQATAATINTPAGVAVDKNGNVYIADQANARIRKVNTSGIITTIAGTGTVGYTADGATASSAQIAQPLAVAVDTLGNVYFAEQNNHRIRKISTTGILSTVAGNGSASFSGDGGAATAAAISYPAGVWVDDARNIYVADAGNNRIRKVNTSGVITTVAGNGSAAFSGDNGAATAAALYNPYGVTTDSAGNVYIADRNNNKIRKVSTAGIISTIVGINATGGNGGPATDAAVYSPQGVVMDGANLYIAAFGEHEVRIVGKKVPYMYSGPYTGTSVYAIAPCKNSAAIRLDSMLTVRDLDLGQIDTFKTRIAPLHGTLSGVPATVATNGGYITPSNIFYTPASGYTGPDTFWIKICDRFDSANIWFFVNVTGAATLSAISGASTVAISTPITLTNATAGGVWSSTNLARATVGSATGVVKGLTAGADTIVYTVDNGCGTSIVKKGITVTAGREENNNTATEGESTDITIYPNPANGDINIRYDVAGNDDMEVRIVDMTGRVIYYNPSASRLLNINTLNWNSGSYILRAEVAGRSISNVITVVH